MLSTVSAIGAQNIGAQKPERAVSTLKYAMLIAGIFGAVIALLVQFIAEPVVSLFTNDIAVAAAGGEYFKGYVFDCFFASFHFCFSGYFCACGKSQYSFLHNIISIIVMRVPGAYFTSLWFPQTLLPMGLATAAGSLVSVIICMIVFVGMKRKMSVSS